jgi:hypothetical protein
MRKAVRLGKSGINPGSAALHAPLARRRFIGVAFVLIVLPLSALPLEKKTEASKAG